MPVASVRHGESCVIKVEVERSRLVRRGRNSRVEATVGDGSGSISVVWFRQPYIADLVKRGARLWLFGKALMWYLVTPVGQPCQSTTLF